LSCIEQVRALYPAADDLSTTPPTPASHVRGARSRGVDGPAGVTGAGWGRPHGTAATGRLWFDERCEGDPAEA